MVFSVEVFCSFFKMVRSKLISHCGRSCLSFYLLNHSDAILFNFRWIFLDFFSSSITSRSRKQRRGNAQTWGWEIITNRTGNGIYEFISVGKNVGSGYRILNDVIRTGLHHSSSGHSLGILVVAMKEVSLSNEWMKSDRNVTSNFLDHSKLIELIFRSVASNVGQYCKIMKPLTVNSEFPLSPPQGRNINQLFKKILTTNMTACSFLLYDNNRILRVVIWYE